MIFSPVIATVAYAAALIGKTPFLVGLRWNGVYCVAGLVLWTALMAGLGHLGAGRAGRAPEVYGATFAVLPPLYLALAALLLMWPQPDWPAGEQASSVLEHQQAMVQAVMRWPLARVTVLLLLLAPLAQFVLAYRGFCILTADRRRALLGTLLPLFPVLAVTALGLAPLLAAW